MAKKADVTRNLDELGRCVIPAEMRNALDIHPGEPIEFIAGMDEIIIRKHHESCSLCGGRTGLKRFHGKLICKGCVSELSGSTEAAG